MHHLVIYLLIFAGPFLGMAVAPQIAFSAGTTYYVSPDGDDASDGISVNEPFKTIQQAIRVTKAGDTIKLTAGEYREDIISQQDGTASNPITISGPAGAVIRGGGNDRIIEVNHDYHTLIGFTVNGLHGSATEKSGYRDTLVYALGKETRSGVKGLKVLDMTLKNAGGECIRLRYFATKAEIARNTITDCGVYDFVFNSGGKNGEGIYIGTSNKQWGDGKNPTNEPDETRDNHVYDNYIETNGNECVDIKEGATANIIENNTCRGQRDPESGGFDSRGNGNIFRYNDVSGSIGAGIRLGGWKVDGVQYGVNNDVYGNTITNNENGGVKFQEIPQNKICDNTMSGNTRGDSVGDFGSNFNPSMPCDENSIISPPPPPDPSPPTSSMQTTGSLANDGTLVANSRNFSDGYGPSKLWDGCYAGSSYDSNTCTTGGRDIASFWLEFDFGKFYNLSEIRLYGDREGEWVSKIWSLNYKENSGDSWKVAFSNENAFWDGWLIQPLDIKARFARVEVLGDSKNFSPGQTQARELEIYGTEAAAGTVTSPPPPSSPSPSPPTSSNSGGGYSYVPPQTSNTPTAPPPVRSAQGGAKSSAQNSTLVKEAITNNLYLGVSNEEVRLLQTFLAKDVSLYPEGLVTGYFGVLTRKAVQRFQCRNDIVCQGSEGTTGFGRVGPRTRAKLNELLPQGTSLNVTPSSSQQVLSNQLFLGVKSNDVELLQTFLAKDVSLYPEGLVTGYFGVLTRKAVQRFQCRNDIVCQGSEGTTGFGRVGPATLRRLNEKIT